MLTSLLWAKTGINRAKRLRKRLKSRKRFMFNTPRDHFVEAYQS
jgi:hypothetical protein